MTRHKLTHTGLVTPSPLDRWINAMLRVLAMLLSNVASPFRMRRRRPPVIGIREMPASLPGKKIDTNQETTLVAASGHPYPIAVVVSRTRSVRVSNHAGMPTPVSYIAPSPPSRVLRKRSTSPCYAWRV